MRDARKGEVAERDTLQSKLDSLNESLRDIHRSINLVKDKQELTEAQARLAELSKGQEVKKAEDARLPDVQHASEPKAEAVPQKSLTNALPAPNPQV